MKDIPGYEGLYAITENGRVWSYPKKYCRHKGKYLSPGKHTDGYPQVVLCVEKRKTIRIHRLMAITYLDRVEGKNHVNHINGDRSDNKLENLEWCSNIENQRHSWEHLGRVSPMKKKKL